MENELEKRFELWSKTFEGLRSVSTDSSHLKSENDILKYSKLCDQFHDPKRVITAEETTIDKLIEQGVKSSRVKMAIQKLQDNEAILDKSLESRRNLLKSDAFTFYQALKHRHRTEHYCSAGNDCRFQLC